MTKPLLHDNISIIEVAESHTLDMLFEDSVAATMLLTRLSERVAVVNPHKLEKLRDRLLKLGHTPKVLR